MTPLRIDNRTARRLWLSANLLGQRPAPGTTAMDVIRALGFLQIDTIRNVARAQDHILWSRTPGYREEAIWRDLKSRALFEHFTHDASLIPAEVLPYWTRRFRDLGAQAARSAWHHSGLDEEAISAIRQRIHAEGPLSTHAFDTKVTGPKEMWARPPHKKALDQMWYAGTLGTAYREGFVKFYDLGERLFPQGLDHGHSDSAQTDWLHDAAMTRLTFATPSEIMRFWQASSPAETRDWVTRTDLIPVEIATADKSSYRAFASPDIETRLAEAPSPGTRMRLMNPFDPMLRDRDRAERLFGFSYRNEMFVPKPKRIYGYYVYPLLEGDRFTGRIELKADRKTDRLLVTGFWPEPRVAWPAARARRLDAELDRFARFAGLKDTDWQVPRPG